MTTSSSETLDIGELARRAKLMRERIEGAAVASETADTPRIHLARDITIDDITVDDTAVEDTAVDDTAVDDIAIETIDVGEVIDLESNNIESVSNHDANDIFGQTYPLDTAQHDSSHRRLDFLASRAKESLRHAQQEAGISTPETEGTAQETEANSVVDDAATSAIFGEAATLDETHDEQVHAEPLSEDIEAEDGVVQPTPPLTVLDPPLSIERDEIDFPEIPAQSNDTETVGDESAADSTDADESAASGAEADPEVAIFARPAKDGASSSTGAPAGPFTPVAPTTTEDQLAPIAERKGISDRSLALGSAAAFLVAVVGVFALLFSLSNGNRSDSTDLAAADTDASEAPVVEPEQTEDSTAPAIQPDAQADAQPQAETEVLSEVEIPTTTVAEPDTGPTAWELLSERADTSAFAALAGPLLEDELSVVSEDSAGVTVFAPSNEALLQLSSDEVVALERDPDALAALVDYHILAEGLTAASLAENLGGQIVTRGGLPILVSEVDGQVVLNGTVPITSIADEDGAHSVIVIDGVLRPPTINQILELNNIQFEVISAKITDTGRTELDRAVEFLTEMTNVSVVIEGHTDTDGDEARNLNLSERRANAVRDVLITNGIDPDRLEAVGFGETRPIVVDGVEDKNASRRIEFVLQ